MEKIRQNKHVFALSCNLNIKAQKHACFHVNFVSAVRQWLKCAVKKSYKKCTFTHLLPGNCNYCTHINYLLASHM